ncbi:hypothetical protein J4E08_22915 [Sagittula sp. NFXS13]|uniref:hypothetical protein n=1 Tax=Sagittula sp. NFXS13 TaxID=2819095 RepID=UPI0032DF4543
MSFIAALIAAAVLGTVAASLVALPRRPLVPVVVTLTGMGSLGALSLSCASQSCQSDPAGCGMQRGFEGLVLWAAAAPLAVGVLTAIAWRIVAGQEANLKARIVALVTMALLICVLGFSITF